MRTLVASCAGAALGLATGWAAWMAAGGPTVLTSKAASLVAELGALQAPRLDSVGPVAGADEAPPRPLFQLTTGPNAVHEPALRLDGLTVTRKRRAALLSIDGRPAEWLSRGEIRDGVTLTDLSPTAAVLDTLVGTHVLKLGDAYPAVGQAPAPLAQTAPAGGHP